MERSLERVLEAAAERELPCLLIGGNAVILHGHARSTVDLDLLVPARLRSRWLDLMRGLGYRFYHGTEVFVQLEPTADEEVPVDLMLVDEATWHALNEGAREAEIGKVVARFPCAELLVALKLHAAGSPARTTPEVDWEDIRQLVRLRGLDPAKDAFRRIILRYGGESALQRIESFVRGS